MKKGILVFVLVCYSFIIATAQQNDKEVGTFDTLTFYVADNNNALEFEEFQIGGIDNFHQYRTFGANHLPYARSGNLGLAMHPLTIGEDSWAVNSMFSAYRLYMLTEDSMKYYYAPRPLTTLSYINGAKTEQLFQLFHTQNLGEGLNVSFKYERITSEGFFVRQLTNHTRFHANYNLHSRNKRFHSRGYYLINNFKSQENGGVFIIEDEDRQNNTVLIDINLFDAQNRFRGQELGTTNQYTLIKRDSSKSILDVVHKITYQRSYRNYQHDLTGSNAAFYNNSYFDTTYTKDSTYADDFGNYLGLSLLNNSLSFGAKYHAYQYFQNYLIDESFNSTFIEAAYKDSLFNQGLWLGFEKGIAGYHEDELNMNARLSSQKIGTFQFDIEADISRRKADFFLSHYRSNQYFRNNDFTTVNTDRVSIKLNEEWSGIQLILSGKNIENYIYFDSLVEAKQHTQGIEIYSVQLSKKFSFFRERLNLYNRIAFQQISDQELVPLPQLYSYHSLYYKNNFFDNNLHVELGLDFYYIGKYTGYAYSPAAAQFHLRKEGQSLGDIQQLDVFVNLEVKENAVLFFKFENLLYDSFSADTYRIENYPIPGRAFKLGLRVRMLN